MGWVNDARKEIAAGRQVQVRPSGVSMRGRIESGQLVTIAPADPATVKVDDVVFVEWHGNYLLHLVKEAHEGAFLIGNNVGKINGWVPLAAVIGKVVTVSDESAGYTMMPLPEHTLRSPTGQFERKVWSAPIRGEPETAIVFLDGGLYLERVRAVEVLEQLQRAGTLLPVASVFVSNHSAAARHTDFTCNEDYAAFVADNVWRWTRERFPSAREIVLTGLSLSGLAAAFIATRYPERFTAVICQSPSFWWEEGRFGREIPPSAKTAPRFWVSVGDQETEANVAHQPSGLFQKLTQVEGCRAGNEALRQQGYSVTERTFAGGHDPNCWREDLRLALPWACGETT